MKIIKEFILECMLFQRNEKYTSLRELHIFLGVWVWAKLGFIIWLLLK